MSLHTKLETHQRQLKAFLEEHTALVEASLAAIEARLGLPDSELADAAYWKTAFQNAEKDRDEYRNSFCQAAQEADELRDEILNLKAERDQIASERDGLLALCRQHEESLKEHRYHGCYNMSGRRARVRTVAEVFTILGGQTHIEATLGVKVTTLQPWRLINSIPFDYKGLFEKALEERGYFPDQLLFRRTRDSK